MNMHKLLGKIKDTWWLIYIMLTVTYSYWCLFISESDIAHRAWRQPWSSTELYNARLWQRWNKCISDMSVIFWNTMHTGIKSWILSIAVQVCLHVSCTQTRSGEGLLFSFVTVTNGMRGGQCCPVTVFTHSLILPTLFLLDVPVSSYIVLSVPENMATRPMPGQRDVDNVCALQLSSGFQVKAITLPN